MYSLKQIQREQIQLNKIEGHLKDIIDLVKEAINVLKVEELQLRSSTSTAHAIQEPVDEPTVSSVIHKTTPTTEQTSTRPALESPTDIFQISDYEINQQEIDLDMFVRPYDQSEMEENEFD